MRPRQKIGAIALAFLLGAAVYGLIRTARGPSAPRTTGSGLGAAQAAAVDQTPILTALKLAQMPTTAEELPFAQEALRIADHEMDLAYAAAERELEEHPASLSADAKKIQARLKEAEDALDVDNAQVARLTAEEAKATGAKKDALEDQLVLATAHQEEHQDEVDDAKEDLARAGGDPNASIEAMIQEHKTSSQAVDSMKITVSTAVEERGLIHRFSPGRCSIRSRFSCGKRNNTRSPRPPPFQRATMRLMRSSGQKKRACRNLQKRRAPPNLPPAGEHPRT
jgi:hypothetical protein